ncbi:MAG TPA: hypothetical protein VGH64_07820, partial [Puia sp.]
SMGLSLVYISRFDEYDASTLQLIVKGQKAVLSGIVFCFIFSCILLWILIPGWLHPGIPGRFLSHKPANTIHDKTGGLDFMVIVNSLIGNFVTGSFITVILSSSLRRKKKN